MFYNDKKPITAYYQHTNNGHAMQMETLSRCTHFTSYEHRTKTHIGTMCA